jgi:hypothetical protein
MLKILSEIWIEIIASLTFFLLGLLISYLFRISTKRKVKSFWGEQVLTDNFVIVLGYYTRIKVNSIKPKCEKIYQTLPPLQVSGPKKFAGMGDITASFFIAQELSKYSRNYIKVESDHEAARNLSRTFVATGGPISNELTHIALKDNKKFVRFHIPSSEEYDSVNNPNKLFVMTGEKENEYKKDDEKDYGFILKAKNPYSKNDYFFVCAGISAVATSGTAWYLAKKWKDLYKEFGKDEFMILLETDKLGETASKRII